MVPVPGYEANYEHQIEISAKLQEYRNFFLNLPIQSSFLKKNLHIISITYLTEKFSATFPIDIFLELCLVTVYQPLLLLNWDFSTVSIALRLASQRFVIKKWQSQNYEYMYIVPIVNVEWLSQVNYIQRVLLQKGKNATRKNLKIQKKLSHKMRPWPILMNDNLILTSGMTKLTSHWILSSQAPRALWGIHHT